MLTRKRQLAAKIESAEGTAETLATSDAKLYAYNLKINHEYTEFPRATERQTCTQLGSVFGKRAATAEFDIEMKGSGAVATAPEFGKFLRACGFGENTLASLTIGAVTNGPFQHGETVTGGTSAATGRVIVDTANGTTTLYVVVLTGTFQGEGLTGGTSGATATSSAGTTNVGKVYEPLDSAVESLTLAGYEDGICKKLSGCRGNAKIKIENGNVVIMSFEMRGADAGITDVAMLTPAVESTTPIVFASATCLFGTYTPKFKLCEIDFGNAVDLRDDPSKSNSLLSAVIESRNPTAQFDPEMELVATEDYYGIWVAGTKAALSLRWGSATGNQFRIYAPQAQIVKVDDGGRSGIKTAGVSLKLCGRAALVRDELAIMML